METGLTVYEERTGDFLAPVVATKYALTAYQAKKEFIDNVLKKGVDFGEIPGATKPALLKPGAEKMVNLFGLAPIFEDVETIEDWTGKDHNGEPFFYYRQRCKLHRSGRFVGSADGSCNSWEKKYRYRKAERVCPSCGQSTIIKGKAEYGGGWLCFAKRGGCGAKFRDGDAAIEQQEVGQVPNPDVAEQVNTILKMAQKRALIAAVLIVTGVSDYFTQDIDDFIDAEFHPAPSVTVTTAQQQPTNGNGKQQQPPAPEEPPAEIVEGEAVEDAPKPEQKQQTTQAQQQEQPVSLAKIGKNRYPASWAKFLASYTRTNQFEVDGILQKLNLSFDLPPYKVVEEINAYLDKKAA